LPEQFSVCPLSRDKISEARFFVERLRQSGPFETAFRYYASAAFSAARSVSLVLQSELRSIHQEAFDLWWDSEKLVLSAQTHAFEMVREARNTTQKEGNLALTPVMTRHYDAGPISCIRFGRSIIPRTPTAGDIDFDVRPGWEEALNPLTEESLAGWSKEAVDRVIQLKVAFFKDFGDKIKILVEEDPDDQLTFEVHPGADRLPKVEVIAVLVAYLDCLDQTLDRADERFGPALGP